MSRIEVDPSLPRLVISAELWEEIRAHALATVPEECCGLIVGNVWSRYQRSVRCRNEMSALHESDPEAHPRDGREAFHMNPLDYLEVEEEAKARDEWITAVYHSHVGFGLYLSELDQHYALSSLSPFPEADQLVLSVAEGGEVEMAMFQRKSGEEAFQGRAVARGTSSADGAAEGVPEG